MENILAYLNNAGTNVANNNENETVKIIYRNSYYTVDDTVYSLIGLINDSDVKFYTSYGVCLNGNENDNLYIYQAPKFGYINIYKQSNNITGRIVKPQTVFEDYTSAYANKMAQSESQQRLYCTTLRVDWREDF